jgi:two-component system, OmpR family, response regulator RegX3
MRVLLAEDDTDLLDLTIYALRKHGFNDVVGVPDGLTALQRWATDRPDIVLLDVNLPGMSGFALCKHIREKSSIPVIMITAHGDEAHVVEGFDCGADDYISKPVSYRQLAMRMRAVLQRRTGAPVLDSKLVIDSGDLHVDLDAHEVCKAGVSVRLTRLETRVLYFLASNAGRTVPTARLIELVWEYEGGDSFALKTHISHVRHKLGLTRDQPGYIDSVPHVGYRLQSA